MVSVPEDRAKYLAKARERFLEAEEIDSADVRDRILASWRRSEFWGVSVDDLNPPFRPDTETDSRLVYAARPVLDRLESALAGAPMSVILTDAHACILERRAGEYWLNRHLDKIQLAPGFSYAEEFVGTNGIGTAIEERQPSRVFGSEHFSGRLQSVSCAGAPITNPFSGRLEGVIDLTSWRGDASSLMQALAQEAAAEIMQRLREQSSDREQALLREFMAANHRSAKAVLALSDDLVMSNDIAEKLLDRADHIVIRDMAADHMDTNHEASSEVVLSRGQVARLRCKPVVSQSGRAGSIVEITLGEATPRHHLTHVPQPEPLAGLAGHSPPWIEATKELEAHCRERSWVLLVGEPGVGKLALTEAAHRRWHPLRRLSVLDLAGVAEADAWRLVNAELTGPSGQPTSDLVLRHMDRLSPSATEALAAGLATVDPSPAGPWIVGTLHPPAHGEDHLGALLQNFTESIPVPPLRHRIEDVRDLVPAFLERHAPGRRITLAPEAMQTLLRGTWPGNVAELESALRSALGRRHSGQITIADLPESVHATSRRVLSEWESIERDAITRALIEARGDKIEASSRLGISRATIYRKIRAFGIMIGPMEPHEVAD